MSCAAFLLVLIAVQQPPVPSNARQELARKLEERLLGLGSLSARIALESIDKEGAKSTAYEAEAHFRFVEGWLFLATHQIVPGGPPHDVLSLHDGRKAMVVWTPGEEGNRVELRWLWRHAYELDAELDRLLESEPESKSLDEWIRSAKPAWLLDVDPDSAGTGSNFRFALGLSRGGSVGWLEGLAQAGEADVVEGKDEVTVRVPARRKTTVIDRNTGFIRSIRNDFESGEGRILTVSQVKTGTPKPEIKLPAKVNDRSPSAEESTMVIATELSGHLRGALRSILDRREKVGAPERAESVRTFFTAAAAGRATACR